MSSSILNCQLAPSIQSRTRVFKKRINATRPNSSTIHQRVNTRLNRHSSVITKAIDPDVVVTSSNVLPYAQFQIVSWILPMTIAGRFLNMDYESISKGLVVIAAVKSFLYAVGVIHY